MLGCGTIITKEKPPFLVVGSPSTSFSANTANGYLSFLSLSLRLYVPDRALFLLADGVGVGESQCLE
jgi:hypothetical protein